MKSKTKKIILSIVLILLSYGFIIYKIASFKELRSLDLSAQHYSSVDISLLLIVLILMFLNWSIETVKWKILIDKIQHFSFMNALQAVFSGITIGIFTPNRIGEIGGRVLFMEKGKRTFGVLATGIGSFAQFITTITAGIFGFALFLMFYPNKITINPIFNNITVYGLVIILTILIWVYFNIKRIKNLLLKIRFFKSKENQLEYLSETKFTALFKVLLLSFARYFVFISQFFLLLIFFNIHLTISQAYITISLVYLFATLIPTTTLIELGIRGSLAIFFIGLFSNNILGIVLSTSLLWFINIAIPSIIGSLFFIKNKL
jgi:lysylphosphatidylglycerol synthase-like protein